MLFSMMMVLAVTSCALELMIAAKVPVWRRYSAKYPLFNLINSLFISFAMGIAFGASGLVAMGAGVISTILSVPGYQFLHWNYDSPGAAAKGGSQFNYYKRNFKVTWNKWKTALSDFGKLMYTLIRFVTFPIWFTRAILTKSRPYIVRFNNWYAARRARRSTVSP